LIGSVGEMIENRCRSAKINSVAAPYGVCRTVLRRITRLFTAAARGFDATI
jgi:hypothetical protein